MHDEGGVMGWLTCALRHAAVATALVVLTSCLLTSCLTTPPPDTPQPGSGVVDLPMPNGEVQRVLYTGPEHPAAVVVPLTGGDGFFYIDGAGQTSSYWLASMRDAWRAQGIAVAALRMPQPLLGRRMSDDFAQTLERVVAYLRTRTDAPIWLVGQSNGTVSAVNGAAHMTHGEIAGIVLLSSVTRENGHVFETVFRAGLDRVNVPTLIVAHVHDRCIVTPPTGVPAIRAALTKAPKTEILMLDGGASPGNIDECMGDGAHSYYGMHPEVIERVAAWINAQRPAD
jgi:hypothetical protein